MLINVNEMKQIHEIQIQMFDSLIKVLKKLEITYYLVHGSLLGAVVKNDFFDEDDDIDIAIFREDYNRLIEDGNKYLEDYLFIQSSINDDFPLGFAKLRNSNTSFIQSNLKRTKCNKGIYIDIFPIDYCINDPRIIRELRFLNYRISLRMEDINKSSLKMKILKAMSFAIYPKYEEAIRKREYIYTMAPKSDKIAIYTGKPTEASMPLEWFTGYKNVTFCNRCCLAPIATDLYLKNIYGDQYLKYNPGSRYIESNGMISISAQVLDLKKSYLEYENAGNSNGDF